MTAIVTSNFRVVNAENFKEDVASAGTSIYVGIGKPDVWSLTLSDTTDTTPFVPVDALDSLGEAHQNLIGMKLIGSSDISHVVPRYTWTASRVYIAWDSDDAAMFDKEFYIVTSEFKVYKCIKAGASGSSIQLTQTLTAPTGESDGYVWKYMYTVSVADAEKFLTTSYLPVKNIAASFYAGADSAAEAALSEADYAQYLNQKASRDSATAAGIERIEVTTPGTYSSTPTVTISGDGTGATATAVMTGSGSSQSVASITVSAKGTNYTITDITFSSGDAAARAVIAPHTGHGVRPIQELGAFFIALNSQLGGSDNTDLTVGNDFRQVTLIRNPQNAASPFAVATATTLKALRSLDFTSGVNLALFAVDEVITGGTSGAKAFIAEIDAATGYIYYHQNDKSGYKHFVNGETITGGTSSATGALEGSNAIRASETLAGSGDIIFLENRNPINRTATQIEDIKVIIEF